MIEVAILILIIGFGIGYQLSIIIDKIILKKNLTTPPKRKYDTNNIYRGNYKNYIIILTGLSFILSYNIIGFDVLLIKSFILACILIVVSFIDLKLMIIPNKIIVFTLLFGIIIQMFDDISITSGLLGMVIGGGILLTLALIVPKGIGGGDIKLMFALGLLLGYKKVMVGIYLAFVISAIVSSSLLLLKLKNRKDYIPFGPFLSIGSMLSHYFFNDLMSYLTYFN